MMQPISKPTCRYAGLGIKYDQKGTSASGRSRKKPARCHPIRALDKILSPHQEDLVSIPHPTKKAVKRSQPAFRCKKDKKGSSPATPGAAHAQALAARTPGKSSTRGPADNSGSNEANSYRKFRAKQIDAKATADLRAHLAQQEEMIRAELQQAREELMNEQQQELAEPSRHHLNQSWSGDLRAALDPQTKQQIDFASSMPDLRASLGLRSSASMPDLRSASPTQREHLTNPRGETALCQTSQTGRQDWANSLRRDQLTALVAALLERQIRVVAFDMDQTITKQHSHSMLERGRPLMEYIQSVAQDFEAIVGALLENGIGLGVATFSDSEDYRGPIQPATHILGEELARTLLQRTLGSEQAAQFEVVAYHPQAHREQAPENQFKRKHIRTIAERHGVAQHNVLLVDDDAQNVFSTEGVFQAALVDARCGLQLQSLLVAVQSIPVPSKNN